MALDLLALGTVPAGEAAAVASESDYAARAFWQCRRFIGLLRLTVAAEPKGARLRVRRSGPDFNPYLEVVVEFDDANHAARAYANRCAREAPTRWDQTAGTALAAPRPSQEILAHAARASGAAQRDPLRGDDANAILG